MQPTLVEVTTPIVVIDTPDLKATLISRRFVPHRAAVDSVVVIAVEIIEVNGQRFEGRIWAHTRNPSVTVRVDTHPIAA